MQTDDYECDLCGRSFDTRKQLEAHAKEAHTKEM